ncbi:MAG: glycosyltransferase family 4 protein [Kamptonema sp. SIO1D9]|nr:glycosyltransferase family 4 protein [Kamptonema sp. SIO1D9]
MPLLYRFGFVLEQTLGHVTHAQNLIQSLAEDNSVQPSWMLVPLEVNDIWKRIRVPNISLLLSLRARGMVKTALRQENLDCLFYHTQLTSLFSLEHIQRIPTVISLDATPDNFETIAAAYSSNTAKGAIARLKFAWYRKIFQQAAALITWSNWVKQSLEKDYGIEADKITVIPPGVHLDRWHFTPKPVVTDRPMRLLFVGGDFERKGGSILLDAFRGGLADLCELDIVTKDEQISSEGSIRVHRGLTPNSPQLQQLFAEADIFVFPTLGDTNAIVVLEAMASGLAVITTKIGALAEEVEDGVNGLLVPVNDSEAIADAVRSLCESRQRLAAMKVASRAKAERYFSAKHNYQALVDILKHCVDKSKGNF